MIANARRTEVTHKRTCALYWRLDGCTCGARVRAGLPASTIGNRANVPTVQPSGTPSVTFRSIGKGRLQVCPRNIDYTAKELYLEALAAVDGDRGALGDVIRTQDAGALSRRLAGAGFAVEHTRGVR